MACFSRAHVDVVAQQVYDALSWYVRLGFPWYIREFVFIEITEAPYALSARSSTTHLAREAIRDFTTGPASRLLMIPG